MPAWLDALLAGARTLARGGRATPAAIDAVIVVGATCAGKTTLVDAVRAAAPPGVVVPERRVTRPPRAGDHPAESVPRTPADLDRDLATGVLAIAWSRALGGDRRERYGFVAAPAGAFAVYSANNAILDDPAAAALVARALVVAVTAPLADRTARLQRRSPDLCRNHPAEVAARLAEPVDHLPARADVILANHGAPPAVGAGELVALVAAAAAGR